MFCGICVASALCPDSLLLMCTAVYRNVSIIGTLTVLIFPVIFSAVLFQISDRLLFLFFFFKAFCYGYCYYGISLSFNSAGWLLRSLLLLSDSFMIINLLLFWLRLISGTKTELRRNAAIAIGFSLAIGIVDVFIVSPFLATLFITR